MFVHSQTSERDSLDENIISDISANILDPVSDSSPDDFHAVFCDTE